MTVEDTWRRIAWQNPASRRSPRIRHTSSSSSMPHSKVKFLPAGRIISGAGTGRRVTMLNCYVLGNDPRQHGGHLDEFAAARR